MSEESASPTPLLDEWRSEVGDNAVAAVVEAARAQIADGSLPGFSDKGELLDYLQGPTPPLGVTWRIFLTDTSQPDLDTLSPADHAAITDELFAWVPNGPPRTKGQVVASVHLFEDQLPSGISVTYFIDEQVPYVAVVPIRRR